MARVGSSVRSTPTARFELVEMEKLHGHELTLPPLLEQLIEEIKRDCYLKRPILVADGDFVVLDGHHRLEALRALGCRRVPSYVVDYFSEFVHLTTWPTATVTLVSKEEVIRRGLSDDRFPPKTTRHTVLIILEDNPTDLEDLI
ncbi:MAG TPA: ParB N-terminal domain-containing protein [Thermoplasmata archaeon]